MSAEADLVVAGGGPVGLAAALHAARRGLDVVVREPREGAVDKACGEGLMPGAVAALAGLGVHPEGHRLDGIRYLRDGHRATARFRTGTGLGVRRTTLHDALAAAARDAGVRVEHAPVRRVEQDDDAVLVDGLRARYLLAADGLHSPVRRLLDLDAGPDRHRRRRYGLRAHVATRPWSSYVEVHWARDAEAYVTPVADELVGVAVLTARPRPYDELLAAFPALGERLAAGAPSRVRGAGPLRQRSRRRVSGRVLLVGDAAGYVDALTGEGIAVGLAQARAAVDAVLAGDPVSYERQWRRIGRRQQLMTTALLALTRSQLLRRGLVPAAARLPGVFEAAVHQLARPA